MPNPPDCYLLHNMMFMHAGVDLKFELTKGEVRIGGNRGDVWARGVWVEPGHVTLHDVLLYSTLELTDEEAQDIAHEIVCEAYANAGADIYRPMFDHGGR